MNESSEYFRIALKEEYAKRNKKNSNFSIRAYAKTLDINSSTLTQILNGKRKLTEKMSEDLGKKLGFTATKIRLIKNGKLHGKKHFKNFKMIEEDAFQVISEWYYNAILELTRCDNFQGSTLWISKVLDLPHTQTVEAVERLKRLKYLEVTPDGKWVDRLGNINNLGNERKAKAFTEHQRQIVKKALEALDKTPYQHRVQSSLTFAVSKSRAKEAKNMILDFLEELDNFLTSGETTDEVYNLSVSFYPLSDTTGEIHG